MQKFVVTFVERPAGTIGNVVEATCLAFAVSAAMKVFQFFEFLTYSIRNNSLSGARAVILRWDANGCAIPVAYVEPMSDLR